MQNFVNEGETITVLATAAAVTGGVPVVINDIVVIPKFSAAIGEDYVASTFGVFTLAKAVGAINQGVKVYWDNVAKNVTTTSAGNTLLGRAWAAALSADTTIPVRLTMQN